MTKEQFITFKEDLKKAIELVKLENKWHKAWWNCGFKSEEEYKTASDERWKKHDEIKKTIIGRIDVLKYDWNEHKTIPTGETRPAIDAESSSVHEAYYIVKHRLNDEEAVEYLKNSLSRQKCYRCYSSKELEDSAKFWLNKYKEGIIAVYENLDV